MERQTHPGRLRFQTFRPGHGEPLTDALIGQGMMSLGGGGYGGGGLPYPAEVLQLWGGAIAAGASPTPAAPTVVKDDGSGEHDYALIAVGPQGRRTAASPPSRAGGLATLRWDSVPGADAYIVLRDGKERRGPAAHRGLAEGMDRQARPMRHEPRAVRSPDHPRRALTEALLDGNRDAILFIYINIRLNSIMATQIFRGLE